MQHPLHPGKMQSFSVVFYEEVLGFHLKDFYLCSGFCVSNDSKRLEILTNPTINFIGNIS